MIKQFSCLFILGLFIAITGIRKANATDNPDRVAKSDLKTGQANKRVMNLPDDKDTLVVKLFYDATEPSVSFAASDLANILQSKGFAVNPKSLDDLSDKQAGCRIVIAKKESSLTNVLENPAAIDSLSDQEYVFRVTAEGERKTIWAIGGDRNGAMYAGIHLGEIVKAFGLDSVKNGNYSPYIAKRGIKFNIPLDERNPSHDDRGTSAQGNVIHMWDFEFWKEYLDELARQRYNVLSLWNQHPFPSMIQLEDYPNVALNDVFNKSGQVKEISIGQKIKLWQRIMDYAYERGIEIYWITWNIHMNGANGKYGITEDFQNPATREYLRKSVEKLFLTYPKLAGIGTTAGENMKGMSDEQREQWLWDTYGKGIQDVKKSQPDRPIRFIHRYWNMDDGSADFQILNSHFSKLPDGYDMSFKYARAKMYASYKPPFAEKELLPILPEGMSTWWNIRNDDIYNLRWGSAEYAKQFILHLPKGDKTAGYYVGSDRFVWGRESISKTPNSPRMLENKKHWYSFLLWGRLGYDPETPISLLKGLIQDKFPTVSSEKLYTAWSEASEIIPLVNKFHWFSWDYLWWPEAGISTGYGNAIKGYHDVNDFINAPVMDESGLININDYVRLLLEGKTIAGSTPFQVADELEKYARLALSETDSLSGENNAELTETIGDIRAMAYLGIYYGAKIKGATCLKLFRESKEKKYKRMAIQHLEKSLNSWKEYSKILDAQYRKMNISMHGIFDWDAIEQKVKEDINIAKQAE